jgi:hypothetical protein
MTQAAQRRLRLDSEARDLIRRQVTRNAFQRSRVEQTTIDNEFAGTR